VVNGSGMNVAVRDLQTLFIVGATGVLSDGELLDRFVARREEAIFEAITHRHGPMVWGVCRRVLRDHHDAEDAFQATFLVLSRKASSVMPREKLGNWLYGVAYQTAMKARSRRAKRRVRESQASDMPEPMVVPHDLRDALAESLDRELTRLPEKYRIPIVLCDLEGRTHKEAASQLGWPIGTVSGRLSRARGLLAKRLSRPGMKLSVGSLAVLLAQDAASACMTAKLIAPTAQAASLVAAGRAVTAGVVSAEVVTLMEGVLKTMLVSKIKIVMVALMTVAVVGGGTGLAWMASRVSAAQEPLNQRKDEGQSDRPPGTASDAKDDPKTKSDMEHIQGVWVLADLEQPGSQPTDEEKAAWKAGKVKITITSDKITFDIDKSFMNYRLDATKTPKVMYLEISDGPNKGQTVPAIYRLDGDDLTYCQGRLGDTGPPTDFSIKNPRPGTSPTLWVLHRKRSLADATRKLKDLDERVKNLRTQLRDAEAELKRAQEEVKPTN